MNRTNTIKIAILQAGYKNQKEFAMANNLHESDVSDYINYGKGNDQCRNALLQLGVSEIVLDSE